MLAAPSSSDTTVTARLATSEIEARRLLDALGESFDAEQVVVGASERTAGDGWLVSLHFREPPNETAVRALVALASNAETANALVFDSVAPRDWVKASLDGLMPVDAGRFLVHGAHDRARLPPNRIGIEIEAALAFGTGHHGTTRGCLLAIDRMTKLGRVHGRVLDLGTGSGVLAIAAARVWHRRVLASDIDARAAGTARENARRNRAGAMVEIIHARGLEAPRVRQTAPFKVVFANILLGPLKLLARPIARVTAANSRVVLSGLLEAQANAALAAYRAQGFALERRILLDGWATMVLARGARTSVAGRRLGP